MFTEMYSYDRFLRFACAEINRQRRIGLSYIGNYAIVMVNINNVRLSIWNIS